MATKGNKSTGKGNARWDGKDKLEFRDFNTPKADKQEIEKRVLAGQVTVNHLAEALNNSSWIKASYSTTDGGWRVMVGYGEKDEFDVVGIYTFRARQLANALALAVWHSEEFDAKDFTADDDDNF